MVENFPKTDFVVLPGQAGVELASDALRGEMELARSEGYDISIADTHDSAYQDPSAIEAMADKLNNLGREFADARSAILTQRLGGLSFGSRRDNRRDIYHQLEQVRSDLLYEPVGGQQWHDQKGSATALITIQEAENLSVDPVNNSGYPTMSAMLPKSIVEYEFQGSNHNSLSGKSLREALASTGKEFFGKSGADAEGFAEKKLTRLAEFIDAPVTREFRDVVLNCTDSLGIRSRKQVVRQEIGAFVASKLDMQPSAEITLASIGCGTALPIFEVAADARASGANPKLILIDQDPVALACAVELAHNFDMADSVEIHCERLFSKFGRPLNLQKILGGKKPDVIEDSGLREYLPDRLYKLLAKESWQNLKTGGMITTGNMNANRPQPEFLHGLMGWAPSVSMRNISECLALQERVGIPAEAIKARVTQDGVYTVYAATKASSSHNGKTK